MPTAERGSTRRRQRLAKEKRDGPWRTWLSNLGCLALFACIFPVFGLVLLALFICGSVVYLLGSIVSLVIPKKHSRIFLFFALAFFCFALLYSVWLRQPNANKKNDRIDNPIVFSKGETISQVKNRFKLFKKDNILISKRQFSDILDRNSPGRVHILTDFTDSVIIINPTNNYRYIHFIEGRSRFKMIGWEQKERIAEGRIDIDIDHDNFINHNKFRNKYKITVSADRPGFQYEIYPQDIKYEVQKLGIAIMQNNLEYFSQNNFKEYFIDSTTFFSFFPSSDLITLFEKNIVAPIKLLEETIGSAEIATNRVTHEERNDVHEGDHTQLSKITTNILKNEEERNKVYDQIDSVKKILLHPNLSRKEKIKLKNFLNNPETESIDFNLLNQIYSVRQSMQNPNLSRKEKRRLKKFIKQLENKIILKNN